MGLVTFGTEAKIVYPLKKMTTENKVDRWMGGWMDGWMGGWVDGWMDE